MELVIALIVYFLISLTILYLVARKVLTVGITYQRCIIATAIVMLLLILIGYIIQKFIHIHFIVYSLIAIAVSGLVYRYVFKTSYNSGFKVATIQVIITFVIRLMISVIGITLTGI